MEEALKRPEAAPHLRIHEGAEPFAPLRLVLQPSGMVLEVKQPEAVVGRHSEADVRLPLPDVSRRHCKLTCTPGGWQVADLNSLNGIQVNGETVLQAPLEHGDLLRIGGFTFAIDLTEPSRMAEGSSHVRSILETLASPSSRKAS
jgi:pSer/pThr/pTyr-binding forkhead associated (FHA) protein